MSSNSNIQQGAQLNLLEDLPLHRSISLAIPAAKELSRSLPMHKVKQFSHEKMPGDNIWDVQSIPTLPMYYPLERTHVLVYDELPSVVAKRISDCMRSLSIAAVYDSIKAKARAQTSSHTKFTIQMFSKSTESGVVVEVRRSSGCSLNFHKSCYPILHAAGGMQFTGFDDSLITKPLSFLCSDAPKSEEDVFVTVEVANNLLKKDRIDANLLGIESLHMLTDTTSTCPETAALVAKMILLGKHGNENIRDSIRSLIENWTLCDEDDLEEDDEFVRVRVEIMRNHALAITANTLDLLDDQGSLTNILKEDSWLTETLLPILINELKEAADRPHDAFLSAKCLSLLVETSQMAKEKAIQLDADSVTFNSFIVGQRCHERLANESMRVIKALK